MITGFLSIDPKIAAVAGGAGSAALAAFGYLAKIRYERKRTLRAALFHLLQLRHCAIIEELVTAELPDRLLSACNAALAGCSAQLNTEEVASVLATAKPILLKSAERQSIGELREIRERLLKSLGELARDLPILAYRLSTALPDIDSASETKIINGADFPIVGPIAEAISNSVRLGIYSEAARESKRNLDRLIHLASFEVGFFAYLETRMILRRQDRLNVPNVFFEAMAKPMAACIQELVNAQAINVAEEPGGAAAARVPHRLDEPGLTPNHPSLKTQPED